MTAPATDFAFANQAVFRALMDAFAHPGVIYTIEGVEAPAPLLPSAAALLQCLADFETPVWLDAPLAATSHTAAWIGFHTGAPIVDAPEKAAFALIKASAHLPDFAEFALGSDEYPDRGTLLIVEVEEFSGPRFVIEGPGIKTQHSIAATPLPTDFVERLAANRAIFPRGVDLVLLAGQEILALPRSIRLRREG